MFKIHHLKACLLLKQLLWMTAPQGPVQNMVERAARNLKSCKTRRCILVSSVVFHYLDHIDKDVDWSIDSKHEVVTPGQNLCPGGPDHQLPIGDHLVGLIGVGDHLGWVATKKHHNYGSDEGGHGCVTPVVDWDGVVELSGSERKSFLFVKKIKNKILIPLNMR